MTKKVSASLLCFLISIFSAFSSDKSDKEEFYSPTKVTPPVKSCPQVNEEPREEPRTEEEVENAEDFVYFIKNCSST